METAWLWLWLSLSIMESMSIELRLKPRGRWYGFDNFSKILVSHLLPQCPCIVKIKSLSSLLEIPLFYVRMKHIEVNCHYVGEKVMFGVISTLYITSSHQLVDIFMKSVTETSCDTMCIKLDMFDLYAPACGHFYEKCNRNLLWHHVYQVRYVWFICSSLRGSVR